MIKRKVVSKNVPPDVSAAKLLIDIEGDLSSLKNMSDEQLEKEKQRLISLVLKEKK